MPAASRLFVLLVTALAAGSGSALAWERAPAPIEFAARAARPALPPSPTRSDVTPMRRAVSAAMDEPDILYGYGRVSQRPGSTPLDLRGRLRPAEGGEVLEADAFDTIAPTQASQPEPMPQEANETTAVAEVAPAVPPTEGAYFVQVGAFADPANAERARAALQDMGPVTIDQRQGAAATLHRVRLGQWPTRAAAELACDMIAERGFAGAVVAGGR
jgi:hypothetical protein